MSQVAHKNLSVGAVALNLTLAALLSGATVAGVYFWTAPIAAHQRIVQRDNTMKDLVPSANQFTPVEGHEGWFEARKDGATVAYLVPGESAGYGGKIRLMVALDPQSTILDFRVLSHNETPGLGDKTTQPRFRQQFVGKRIENLEVVKVPEEGKIDAITGVTISSKAVTKAVRGAVEALTPTLQGSQP